LRRLCATLLLALFGLPLILPAIRVESEAKLPACCRREGKHHCGMPDTARQQETPGAAIREKCSVYPGASAIPAYSNATLLNATLAFYSSLVKHPAVQSQTEALQRISFSRSRQKRGPPVLSS
jgi:hypothetical protein